MTSPRTDRVIGRMLVLQPPLIIYIMMSISIFIGFTFATGLIVGLSQSVLYQSGVLFDRNLWGVLVFIMSSLVVVGCVFEHSGIIRWASMGGFLLWIFACISLAIYGHWYIFVTVGLFHMLNHCYIYLAETTGNLRR